MKTLIVLGAAFALAGCATSGQVQDHATDWATYEIRQPVSVAIAGMQRYSRYCGGLLGVGYVPEWYQAPDGESADVDIYFPTQLGGRSSLVVGVIRLQQEGNKTIARATVRQKFVPWGHGAEWWKSRFSTMFGQIGSDQTPVCT